ncbi:MAG: Lyzozyme M1 (1,4-beta-N-acetylmuramidase) [Lachnospiraceae bacterium]|nr:Lyzozyme M1 (1,4-beta-N-acetylmuramidase) [Lachnospiraceae bacterium]
MQGIDISHYQKNINLAQVKGLDFVIIKATQGTGFIDPSLKDQISQAVKLGIPFGLYHYASQGGAEKEAQHFIDTIKGYIGKAILVLDWESGSNKNFNNPGYARAFLDYVKEKTGVTPFIYMSKSVCRQFKWGDTAAKYPLWVAQYKNKKPTGWQNEPWTDAKGYGAWISPLIFQYTSTGRVEGYGGNLDLDIAYISESVWDGYTKSSKEIDVDAIAQEVIDGKWGNGEDRKKRLTEAGYDYKVIQSRVNALLMQK